MKTKKSVWGLLLLLCLCGILLGPGRVMADQTGSDTGKAGWVKDERGYRYQKADGTIYATGKEHWKTIDGKRYYILADGYRKTGALVLKGKRYYLNREGVRVTGWMQSPVNRSVWYYFDPKWGNAATGSRNVKGKYYYFSPNGKRIHGIYKRGRVLYVTDAKTGVALKGLQKINGKTYYLDKTGRAKQGFIKFGGNSRRYFDPKMFVMQTGFVKISGKTYYFDPQTGVMKTNQELLQIGNSYYTIDGNGVVTETSGKKALCAIKTRDFIKKHTSENMTNAQKFRQCFQYIMQYNDFVWWDNIPTNEEFKGQEWPYDAALYMLQFEKIRGSCYGIASLVASCAKELGYEPYVIAVWADHAYVRIDGLYYDNMYGSKFGSPTPSFATGIRSVVKF